MCFLSIPLYTQAAVAAANRRKRQRKPGPSTPSPTRGWQPAAAAAPHTKPKMDPPRHQQQSGPAPLRRPASGWATARSPSLLPTRRVFRVIRWSVSSGGVVEVTWFVWSAAFVIVRCCFVFDQLPMRSVAGVIRIICLCVSDTQMIRGCDLC
jgi:hypothetical protein